MQTIFNSTTERFYFHHSFIAQDIEVIIVGGRRQGVQGTFQGTYSTGFAKVSDKNGQDFRVPFSLIQPINQGNYIIRQSP